SSETAGSGSDSGGPAEATSTEDADGGATLVGYGARTTSSKRRPRKGAPVPSPSAASAEAAPAPAESGSAAPSASTAATSPSPAASAAQPGAAGAGEPATVSGAAKPLAKPPVRKLAKDLGVDLSQVVATGPHGDVTRDDVRGAADQVSAPTSDATATTAASASDRGEAEERIPFKGVTKMMAKAMVDSAFTMPHVTEFLDVDVTETMAMVRRLKSTKFLGEDVKVSPLAIVAKAVAWAVERNPRINACLDGDEIVVKKYVNLGIAAATPRGLIVPNIKNAHSMGLGELAQGIQDLTAL